MTSVLQAPGFRCRKVGDVIVTALNGGFIILPPAILQGISAEEQDTLYRAAGRCPLGDCDQWLSAAMGWRHLPGFTRIGRSADADIHHPEV